MGNIDRKSPGKIVYKVLNAVPSEMIGAIGNLEVIYRILRKYRNKILNQLPYLYNYFKLSRNLAYTAVNNCPRSTVHGILNILINTTNF